MPRLAPYLEQHKTLNGPGDARPTAVQIVEDQGLVGKWSTQVVLVTGCSPGGIGPEAARAFHIAGADVFIAVRDVAKGEHVAKDILSDGKPGKIEVIQMDLASLDSTRAGAKEFLSKSKKLNVLLNNAGIMGCPQGKTKDGFELQFGICHLGHFLLFQLLKPTLLASSTPEFNSRVISVASAAHRDGHINLDDPNWEKTEYDAWLAYGQAKLANIHFSNALDRRYGSSGLHAWSIHPGGIFTPLQKFIPNAEEVMSTPEVQRMLKSPEQGSATSVWAAVAKELEGKGGKYLEDVSESEPVSGETYVGGPGYAPQAYDPPTENALWTASLKMLNLEDDQ
ncbi:short-chain dehydrogenase [Ilyonectria destructans]|nr:short-chain dehydrogenase [Ilyonectria destructans]